MTVQWWQYFQVEIGGRWQLVPSRDMTWKEWAFSPHAGFVYPGKPGMSRATIPDGEIYGGLERRDDGQFVSLIHWYSVALRILGLDLGIGIFIRTKKSADKLAGKAVKTA